MAVAILLVVLLASLRYGARPVSWSVTWDAVFRYDPRSPLETVVRQLRGSRTLIGLVVGPAFAVAGALMQAVTRNPLADPGILGINAGAGLAVAAAIAFAGVSAPLGFVWFAFGGAAVAAALGYGLGAAGRGGPTPVKLTIAGAILASLIGSITSLLVVSRPVLGSAYAFWVAGSIAGRPLSVFWAVLPFIVVGLVAAMVLSRSLNVLGLGDQMAAALGQRVVLVRAVAAVVVVLLAGSGVAAAGPIAFVGLAVPNAVRVITGPDYRWIIPFSALAGAVFLLGADIIGRVLAAPGEIEASVIVGLVGGPLFVLIARRRRLPGL